MLSALFRASKHLILTIINLIQLLSDDFPVDGTDIGAVFVSPSFLFENIFESYSFLLAPAVRSQVDFFKAKPFEKAGVAGDTWDEFGDVVPVAGVHVAFHIGDGILICVLGNYPDQYFNIFFTPIFFESSIFDHFFYLGV